MITLIVLLIAVAAVAADPSPLDNGYCQIVVHHSQWCIGINSQGKARNMPCSSQDTHFHLFDDGSLRLQGRENNCLKRGSTRDMVYGSCSGAYTFEPKYITGAPNPKTYKIYSTNPSYKNQFFDIVGTSPKSDASAIFYSPVENYPESDHYYDLKNCVPLTSPVDTDYCQIVVHHSQWCIGINSQNQARNMPCSNDDTHFHRFKDGSLRLIGRENNCLKRGSTRDMVYGSCSGAYTFRPKYRVGPPNPKTYKVYSTNPSYTNEFFDIVGTSPKSDASAIFYSAVENYPESDHYYDLKNCVSTEFPLTSPMDVAYCQIVVHHSQWCIGINSKNQARNMPCNSKDTHFRRFPDGSLRLKGREDNCLKRGSTRDMVYGSCSGAYTFEPKFMPGEPNPNTYKIYSTNPSYKNYFFDIVGTSPKADASAIFYSPVENYPESDHYYDIKNCEVAKGMYIDDSDDEYKPCPANYYCENPYSKKKCPNGGKSSEGSSSVNDCARDCTCTQHVVGANDIDCDSLKKSCKCS